ncbi:MAG: AMP-binding protein, partial [Anaerolineae bacterium]|nr:AMP-binding protein [Anaerolineae bacterium]
MSTVAEFLNNLRARDIKIWVEDDRLRINAPKGAIDEALKVELGQRKSEVIAYLNATSTTQSRNTAPLIPVDRSTPPPLSFTQQRLWFLDQMEPDSTTFSLPVTMRLTGVLNVAALEESIRRIVQRHEVLRTTFSQENGRPVQIIHPTIDDYLTQIDLSSYPAHEHLDMAVNLIEADFDQPFDLANDQLIRSKLFKLAETDHILLISLHHIITDRWSIALMWHELTSIYNELVTGKQSSLPHLPIQYADYAAWQQLWLESEDYQAQLAYWQKQLSGTLPTFDLPLDHPRPVHAANRGGTFQRILPADLVQKIRQISQAHGATLYMTMLAALKTLLFRYTGQEDLLIGTSIANRNHEEIINLIGFFVNTLLLRTDLSGQPSFLALLDRVKQVTLDAFANQDMPVEKLIELLHPNRDGGQAALFDVLFIFQNTPDAEGELAHIKTDPFPLDFERAMFDLTWYVVEQAEGLEIDIEYDADLFERSTIDRLVTHFQCLLESIAAAPHEPISLLAMLPTQEQAVLAEWGHGKSVPLPSGCVHHWFEAQAAAIPDKTAVSHQSQQLSYAQLNARANQLAHYLIEKGIAPDTIVGLHVPRSIEMIVALLGILKAGGAYLPLDPTYPESRLQFMVEDAQPAVILALGDLSFALPDGQAAQIVQLGDT